MRQIKLVKQSTCQRNILQADYDSSVLYRMDAVIFVALEGFGPMTFPWWMTKLRMTPIQLSSATPAMALKLRMFLTALTVSEQCLLYYAWYIDQIFYL